MNKKLTTVAVSGYFDPIHVGHLEYLQLAKKLGDNLIVIINKDFQLKRIKEITDEKEIEKIKK